jgi:hypothetical protein
MPDFDTRTPQEPNEPRRHRVASIGDKLRALLDAAKSRVASIANRVRSLLSATTLRALLIGGGLLFFVAVAVPVGLLIYSSGGKGTQQVAEDHSSGEKGNRQVAENHSSGGIGDQQWEAKNANLKPLAACPDGGGGHRPKGAAYGSNGEKIVFSSGPQTPTTTTSSNGITSEYPGLPGTGMYAINADGSGLTQLTKTTTAELGISHVLPDGTKVTFAWFSDGRKLQSISYDYPNVVQGLEDGNYGVCSPDGKKLAAITTTTPEATDSDSSAPPDDTDVSVHTSAGTTHLGDPGYDYTKESAPVFSPDSQNLAFTKDEQVYVANADGSEQRQLANNNKMRYTEGSLFSPDSKKIVFQTDTPGGPDSTDLYAIDVDGTDLTRLTHNTKRFGKGYSIQEFIANNGGVQFSPDGKKIAFVIDRIKYTPPEYPDPKLPIRYDMYVVNVDGTGLTRLTHTEALEETAVAWAGG